MRNQQQRRLTALILLTGGWMVCSVASVSATEWTVPVSVSNDAAVSQELILGIHPDGTYGVDPGLGEVGLPPWPPTAVFDARFLIDGIEGLHCDIRDDSQTARTHKIKWQAGDGGYPIVVRWNGASLPPATFTMSDGYTGTLIPAFDMTTTDSLVIPPEQSYIKRLDIVVIPGEVPPAPPVITPVIPDLIVFDGQQFPELSLDDYVVDSDTPDADLEWIITGDNPPWVTISTDRMLSIESPPGWIGARLFNLRVMDPGGLEDDQDFLVSTVAGGLPTWITSLNLENGSDEQEQVHIGIHPDGTDGIDPALGEVALPPWPPSAIFNARMLLVDELTHTERDIRQSGDGLIEYHLQWQAGEDGHPVTVTWSDNLPAGEFTIRDDIGGTILPPLDMRTTQNLVVPDTTLSGLIIAVEPMVDTTPPQGPAALEVTSWIPDVSVTLDWSSWECIEENFAYYEILFDTDYFEDEADYYWDWSEDADLGLIETSTTTVRLPMAALGYVFRIRAWDAFGNVGPVSQFCFVGQPAEVSQEEVGSRPFSLKQNWPNPFNPRTTIHFTLSKDTEIDLDVYNACGRLVRNLTHGILPAGEHAVIWDGHLDSGEPAASGMYFFRVVGDGLTETRKMTILR
ncbi:MAG: T9SS type A sorting domain-containing protein [Candidatus Eisenbacteria bacterium]|nr:T9SS type A sorting domain-containing protein [Candidatus Eisenbacteria bacterium]